MDLAVKDAPRAGAERDVIRPAGPPAGARTLLDVLTPLATGALLLALLWRVALTVWLPAPARAAELLAETAGASGDRGRVVLLVDTPGTIAAQEAAGRARELVPRLPLEVRALHAAGEERDAEQLRSLVRAYGYSRLPLLLTLDEQGHVVRIVPI